MATTTQKNIAYPFPFFGAGIANYYEWCGVHIRFLQAPTKDAMKEIIKLAPKPIKPRIADFNGKLLGTTSGQFVNMYIEEAYGASKAAATKLEDEEFEEDDDEYLEFFASEEAHKAFEAHIEQWLLQTHAICPIEMAYRAEDDEAGGTKLSAWHKKSLATIPDLLNKWANDSYVFGQKKRESAYFQYLLSGVLAYGKIKESNIPTTLLNTFFPEIELDQLFATGDINAIAAHLNAHKNNTNIADVFTESLKATLIHHKDYDKINQLFEQLSFASKVLDVVLDDDEVLGAICHAVVAKNHTKLKAKLVKKLSNKPDTCEHVADLACYLFEIHGKEPWPIVIALYQMAFEIEKGNPCTENPWFYCNALWVAQNDNTHLPVNKALNEAFLERCLPHAPANPAIFFNAACLSVEMNDYAKAFEYVQLAHQHQYDGYETMINEINTAELFKDFRTYAPFATWLTSNSK